jgi:integrase/recombinase XerC
VDEAGSPFASANTLRHTFGTSLRRSGVDVVVVAELMGHRRLATDEEL